AGDPKVVTQEKTKEMARENHNHDDDDDGGGWNMWNFIPHAITALVAVAGIIVSLLWTLSDLKVRDMEMGTKLTYLEQRVEHLEDSYSRRVSTTDADRKGLWNEVQNLKDMIGNIEEQHKNGKR
ncbi:hypothetical protein EB001_22955, partial [bacterium]|nr:hypothetical protein [bacterium]